MAMIINDFVYFSSDDGYLYCLDLYTGESIWQTYIGNNVSKRIGPAKDVYTYDYMCSSPKANEGKIYIGSMDS